VALVSLSLALSQTPAYTARMTTDTGRAVCLFMPQPSLVLTVCTHGGMARLSWPGWVVTCQDGFCICRWSVTHPSINTDNKTTKYTLIVSNNHLFTNLTLFSVIHHHYHRCTYRQCHFHLQLIHIRTIPANFQLAAEVFR